MSRYKIVTSKDCGKKYKILIESSRGGSGMVHMWTSYWKQWGGLKWQGYIVWEPTRPSTYDLVILELGANFSRKRAWASAHSCAHYRWDAFQSGKFDYENIHPLRKNPASKFPEFNGDVVIDFSSEVAGLKVASYVIESDRYVALGLAEKKDLVVLDWDDTKKLAESIHKMIVSKRDGVIAGFGGDDDDFCKVTSVLWLTSGSLRLMATKFYRIEFNIQHYCELQSCLYDIFAWHG